MPEALAKIPNPHKLHLVSGFVTHFACEIRLIHASTSLEKMLLLLMWTPRKRVLAHGYKRAEYVVLMLK